MLPAYQHTNYTLRRQVFALTGKFRIYNETGEVVLFSQQKMFKLKEDIRVYADEAKTSEVLTIKARQILDFSASYDVVDSQSGQVVGVIRRKGLRSMLRDEWELLDANEQQVGVMHEDNITMALLRRFVLGRWLPQNYDIMVGGQKTVDVKQRFNPFRYELDIDFSMDSAKKVDRRLGLAAALLLATIEGRQE